MNKHLLGKLASPQSVLSIGQLDRRRSVVAVIDHIQRFIVQYAATSHSLYSSRIRHVARSRPTLLVCINGNRCGTAESARLRDGSGQNGIAAVRSATRVGDCGVCIAYRFHVLMADAMTDDRN